MFEGKKILALIPARGGSKGIKNKNIVEINGKPLIVYSIDAGLQSKYVDMVLVSTDSEEIAGISKEYGAEVPFLRPAEFAQDASPTADAIQHALNMINKNGEFDSIVLLQPTSPLRTAEDIDKAIELYFETNCEGVVSVTEVSQSPILMREIDKDGKLKTLLEFKGNLRRQNLPKYYILNGSIYIEKISKDNTADLLNLKIPFIMSKDKSIDIDEWEDLIKAEKQLQKI